MRVHICDECGCVVLPHKNLGVQQIDDLDFCLDCFHKYSSKIDWRNHTIGHMQLYYNEKLKDYRLNKLRQEAGLTKER